MRRALLVVLLGMEAWVVVDGVRTLVSYPNHLDAFAFQHYGVPALFWVFEGLWVAAALVAIGVLFVPRRWGLKLLLGQVGLATLFAAVVFTAAQADPDGAARAYEAGRIDRGIVTSPQRAARAFSDQGLQRAQGVTLALCAVAAILVWSARERFLRTAEA